NLDFIGGFAPTTGETFDILSGPSLSSAGAFSNINVIGLEPGWRYAVQVQNGIETIESLNNGVAVPEPSSLVLALGFFGAMGLWWRWSRTTRLPHWSRGWTPAPN
ncbi:MAG TPA: PEP-CTERM sorting domain-containing protein, partial [Pirellulales bacterium]|nr:PEP-CTERM sorting domain-containing protein [Pirellulales bacterium]